MHICTCKKKEEKNIFGLLFFPPNVQKYDTNVVYTYFSPVNLEATTSNNNIAQSALLPSNNLNPQAPIFVPTTTYKQDFMPKSYADVVNANKDPSEDVTDSFYAVEDTTSL